MSEYEILVLVHAAATWGLVGLIWFIQVVHYPLFARVGGDGFARYEQQHARRTAHVVVPLMLTELACAALLLLRAPGDAAVVAGAALLAVVWLSTFLLQVPRHRELAGGFDARAHRRLVTTNWIRTSAWSVRGVIAGLLLVRG